MTGVMTLMWSSLEGGLLPMRKLRPVLTPLQRPPSENAKAWAKDA